MAWAPGGFRRRALLLTAAFLVGAVAVVALRQGTSGASRVPEDPAERMVLRLHDLPLGYYLLDFSEGAEQPFECEELRPTDPGLRLKSFVRRFAPRGCLGLYLRAYRIPGAASAAVVGTGAMDTGSAEAAQIGLELAPNLLAKLTEERLEEVPAPQAVGDAARLFHWKHAPAFFRSTHLGSFLAWRSGSALAAVFASAGPLATSDWIVAELAERQQAHVANPTPYTRAERNSSEVLLDDPALTFSVHWLGRNFDPGHGLPPIRLQWGGTPPRGEALPGQKLSLSYSKSVYLDSWTRTGWKRFLSTRGSRIMRTWHCTESVDVEIPGGHARVFAAHGRDFHVCPDRPPSLFFAFAYIDGTVTAVDFISCRHCGQVPYGPYNSLRGMKEVVRGLRLRPEPVYPGG
jgi:hypothetical protein